MRKIASDFIYENGSRAVLLLHAYTGSVIDVKRVALRLKKAGYTVKAMNFSGHNSGLIEDYLAYDTDDWIQDASQALLSLRASGFKEIAVFGLSLGGVIATRLLIDDPDLVGGGCFCSPIMANDIYDTNVKDSFMQLANDNLEERGLLTDENLAKIEDKLSYALQDIDDLNHSVRSDLTNLDKPYFIAKSEKDEMVPPYLMDDLYRATSPYTDVTFKSYPNSGHVVTVGPEFQKLAEDLIEFLSELL